MEERDFAIWKELTIDFQGRTVSGSYSTSRQGLVTVKTLRGSKTTTLGGSNARVIARILLRELARKEKRSAKESGPYCLKRPQLKTTT
jgi:hypothetical protein